VFPKWRCIVWLCWEP